MCRSTWSPATPSSPCAKEWRKLFIIVIFLDVFFCLETGLWLTYFSLTVITKAAVLFRMGILPWYTINGEGGFEELNTPFATEQRQKRILNIKESFYF